MTPLFNIADSATWPLVMTIDDISAIYDRPVGGIRKSCQRHTFTPSPYKTKPYRWRKVDVLRDVEGARNLTLARRAS